MGRLVAASLVPAEALDQCLRLPAGLRHPAVEKRLGRAPATVHQRRRSTQRSLQGLVDRCQSGFRDRPEVRVDDEGTIRRDVANPDPVHLDLFGEVNCSLAVAGGPTLDMAGLIENTCARCARRQHGISTTRSWSRLLQTTSLLALTGLLTGCGGGDAETAPDPAVEGLAHVAPFTVTDATLRWPERLLQISNLAADVLRAPGPGLQRRLECAALAHIPGGAGHVDLAITDTGPPGFSDGDQIVATFHDCPSLTVNGKVDGTLVITLSLPYLTGSGAVIREFAGTLDLGALKIDEFQFSLVDGILGFAVRESLSQTRLAASTSATGMTLRHAAGPTSVAIRNAAFSRDDDRAQATRTVNLDADYALNGDSYVVPFSARQLMSYTGPIGAAPFTGQLQMVDEKGGALEFTAAGDMTDTSYFHLTGSLGPGSIISGTRQWHGDIEGFLWWDPFNPAPGAFSYTFANTHPRPMAVRETVPGTAPGTPPVLVNPVELMVYLTDRATQASATQFKAVRTDASQPDVDVNVQWDHAILVLSPAVPLAPGQYQFRSVQRLQPESGSLPTGEFVVIGFEVR